MGLIGKMFDWITYIDATGVIEESRAQRVFDETAVKYTIRDGRTGKEHKVYEARKGSATALPVGTVVSVRAERGSPTRFDSDFFYPLATIKVIKRESAQAQRSG